MWDLILSVPDHCLSFALLPQIDCIFKNIAAVNKE